MAWRGGDTLRGLGNSGLGRSPRNGGVGGGRQRHFVRPGPASTAGQRQLKSGVQHIGCAAKWRGRRGRGVLAADRNFKVDPLASGGVFFARELVRNGEFKSIITGLKLRAKPQRAGK